MKYIFYLLLVSIFTLETTVYSIIIVQDELETKPSTADSTVYTLNKPILDTLEEKAYTIYTKLYAKATNKRFIDSIRQASNYAYKTTLLALPVALYCAATKLYLDANNIQDEHLGYRDRAGNFIPYTIPDPRTNHTLKQPYIAIPAIALMAAYFWPKALKNKNRQGQKA